MRRLVRYAGLAGRAPAPAPQLPSAGTGAHEPLQSLGFDVSSDGANATSAADVTGDSSSELVIRGVVFDVRWSPLHLSGPLNARC